MGYVNEVILATMGAVIIYSCTTTTTYADLAEIKAAMRDNSMAWNLTGYVPGSGWHSGSLDKNFHIAQHNDRPF